MLEKDSYTPKESIKADKTGIRILTVDLITVNKDALSSVVSIISL